MHWYGGSIAEAVNLSKQKNAIFVVFVEGDNDLSAEMAATIDDSAVVKRLSDQTNFLAVKLKSGSENYTHFAQIYQFVPVPSLFFIGRNGAPLEVVCAGVRAGNLAARIDRILEDHHNGKKPTGQVAPSTSTQNVKEQTASLLQSEAAESGAGRSSTADEEPETSSGPAAKVQKTSHNQTTTSDKEYEMVCDGDVCVRRPRAPGAGPSREPGAVQKTSHNQTTTSDQEYEMVCDGDVCVRRPRAPGAGPSRGPGAVEPQPQEAQEEDNVSMEEKLEKAKEMIEARRREKAEKEKELEKQKELERRSQGQGVAELKKWQADQELKQIQEERKREKLENNLARQRILEQIAQDRAERRARDLPPAAPPAPPASDAPTSGDGSSRARVQFKLPDGTSHTAHFDADDTLGDVQRYIADNLQMAPSSFALWTAFPRRELIESASSLRVLQLAPSAALLVLPRPARATVAAPAPLSNIVALFTQFITSFILTPSQQLFAWLRSYLFTVPLRPPRPPRPPPYPARPPGPAPPGEHPPASRR